MLQTILLEEEIKKVEWNIIDVEKQIDKASQKIEKFEEEDHGEPAALWFKKEEQLRKKEEQLRTEKEQLRKKEEQLRQRLWKLQDEAKHLQPQGIRTSTTLFCLVLHCDRLFTLVCIHVRAYYPFDLSSPLPCLSCACCFLLYYVFGCIFCATMGSTRRNRSRCGAEVAVVIIVITY